jgi:transposase
LKSRREYAREAQRYASDLTDAEWALIEPHMPAVKRLGRPRETELRGARCDLVFGRTGCQWRMLPKDFPPFTTVQGYFYDWRDDGLFFETGAWQRISRRRSRAPKRVSTSPRCSCSLGD